MHGLFNSCFCNSLILYSKISLFFLKNFNLFNLQGEIYWKADPKESPMKCPAMKDSSAHQNMMYLWVSDYMFETIAYVAQKHNILVHNLTADDVSRYN